MIQWYNTIKHVAIPQLQCDVCGVVGLVENSKPICLFDMPNHYIVCPTTTTHTTTNTTTTTTTTAADVW